MFQDLKGLAVITLRFMLAIFVVLGVIIPVVIWVGEKFDEATENGMHLGESIIRFGDPATLTDEIQLATVVEASDLSDAVRRAGSRAKEVHCVAGGYHTVFNLPDIHAMDSPLETVLAEVGPESCENGHILTYRTIRIKISPNP